MKDKVYFITGATGAIGGATAKKLDQLGAKLILCGRDVTKLQTFVAKNLSNQNHLVLNMNLENVAEIENSMRVLSDTGMRVDGFVHASGIGEVRPLKMTNPTFIQKVFNVNFVSFIEITRLLSAAKLRNTSLSVVGVSAIGAFQGNATKTAYCASKAAMNAAVRCLAIELGNKGVRINTVAPGATRSTMMDDIVSLPNGQATLDKISERQFLGICEPEDIADGIIFLLSDSARMISGICLPIDGGKLST